MQEPTRNTVPPYVSYKTFSNFVESLRVNGVPSRVDRSLMATLSGSVQAQLLTTLHYLGLLTTARRPSPDLKLLIEAQSGPTRQRVLGEILRTAYSAVFESVDLKSVTLDELSEAFERVGASGDTVRRCTAFFLKAAQDAHMKLSPYLARKQRKPTKPRIRLEPGASRVLINSSQLPGNPPSAKTIRFQRGSRLELSFEGQVFDLDKKEQAFLVAVLEAIRDFEAARKEEPSSDFRLSDSSGTNL